MNRGILFRGFHECTDGKTIIKVDSIEKRGEWVEGCYVYDYNRNIALILRNEVGAVNAGFKPPRQAYSLADYEVIPSTVGQFTELCDKNGNRIFEHDIVKAICRFDGANMYVEYDSSVATFCLFDKDKIGFKYLCDIHNREVIGNIFENSDLIGDNENA